MGFLSEPTHLILIALLLFVLFGAKRLPELGKGLGEGLKGFKEGIKGISDPSPAEATAQQSVAVVPPVAAAPAVSTETEYIVCSRCGSRFENPLGIKVSDYVCKACAARS
jgi:sec-independent protein translocase protein TatA